MDTCQGLFESLEQERLRDASAKLDGTRTKALHLPFALLEQYQQVFVIVEVAVRVQQPLVVGADELGHLPLLGDEGRVTRRNLRVETEQLRLKLLRRHPQREHLQRIQHLAARTPHRGAVHRAEPTHGTQQAQPAVLRHGRHPARVIGLVEHHAQHVPQVVARAGRRIDTVVEQLAQLAEQAAAGEQSELRVDPQVARAAEPVLE